MPSAVPVLALLLVAGCAAGTSTPTAASPHPSPSLSLRPGLTPDDPLSPRPALESAAPVGQPTCEASTLSVTDADLLADAHTLQEVFVVRTSGAPCQLTGWPSVTVLDAAGHAVPLTARRVGTGRVVTLTAGTSLSFLLGTPRTTDCTDAATLVVRLPGTDRDLRADTTLQVCEAALTVGPMERRADAE